MENIMSTIGSILGMIAAAGASFGITFWRTMKAKKGVQSEAEVAKVEAETSKEAAAAAEALIEIRKVIKDNIVSKELNLSDLHDWLKTRSGTAGGLKFELVLTAVQLFCLAHQYKYELSELEEMIREEVEFTKKVNVTTK